MKTEKVLAIIFLIGIFFRFMNWEGAGLLITVSLLILSILYFPFSFYFFCDKTIKNQNLLLTIVSGFFLSVVPVGILFKLRFWEGWEFLLLGAVLATLIILSIVIYQRSKAVEELNIYYRNMLIRTGILTGVAILLYVTPVETLVRIQHPNDPELARLKTQYYLHPDNEDFKSELDLYMLNQESK